MVTVGTRQWTVAMLCVTWFKVGQLDILPTLFRLVFGTTSPNFRERQVGQTLQLLCFVFYM